MFASFGFLLAMLITGISLPFVLAGEAEARPLVKKVESRVKSDAARNQNAQLTHADALKVLTLNVAHGRNKSINQVLLHRTEIRSNLDRIATVLKREAADVVALQEVDGVAVWSGRFNHVSHLASKSAFPYFVQGKHVEGLKLAYGTALLSRCPLDEALSVRFKPVPPTWSKGFVRSTLQWPGKAELQVDVISMHLDFSRASVRRSQVAVLRKYVRQRSRPLVLMGDFNCEWSGEEDTLRSLARELQLKAYAPEEEGLKTFPMFGTRLDWILISEEFEFLKYEVLEDDISDHLGVAAEIGLVSAPRP